jgi:ankyrin repeat protein
VSENRREIAKVLLDAGANPDTPRKRDKVAPIHIATSKCLYDMIQILIDHKHVINFSQPFYVCVSVPLVDQKCL